MAYDINTFDDLCRYYGKQKGMQERFGLSQPGVSHWGRRGIPPGYHLRIYLELRSKGLTINPELFEMSASHADMLNSLAPPSVTV